MKKSQRTHTKKAPPPVRHVQTDRKKAPTQQPGEESEVDWEESDDEPAPVKKAAEPKSILKTKSQPDEDDAPTLPKVSRAVQERLDEDEREIRALEKKLGKRKKSAGGGDDGLDDLFGDLADPGVGRLKACDVVFMACRDEPAQCGIVGDNPVDPPAGVRELERLVEFVAVELAAFQAGHEGCEASLPGLRHGRRPVRPRRR